jgi:hypothetical protein
VHGDALDGGAPRGQVGRARDGGDAGGGEVARVEPLRVPGQHRDLVVAARQVHRQLELEPVELRLRQRVGALVLHRVLGGGDDERVGEGVAHAVHGDLPLLHRLQQRRLRLRRGAVDLVGEQEVREHRPSRKENSARPAS